MIDIKQTTCLKIVKSLIEIPSQTIRDLSRATKTAYYLIHKNVTQLHKSGMLQQEKAGNALLCSLNHKAALDYMLVAELRKKEEFFEQNRSIRIVLEELQEKSETPFFILLVFGSYAKGVPRKKSDVDLLILVEDIEQTEQFEALIHDVSRTTSLKLHPVIADINSFEKMLQKPKELNVANESLNQHILINGVEQYWKLRIKNER